MIRHFQQPISEQVWNETYKWETDKDFNDTCKRVAKAVSKIEKERKSEWEQAFYDLLINKRYVPAGRIWSNAGTELKKTTLINCFVSGFEGTNQDSIEGIYKELSRQARILSSEGGYGINFSVLRPKSSYVSGIGVETSGAIEFMNLWDTSSDILTKGSGNKKDKSKGKVKIRKGAQMGMMYIWHPSIEEFIVAKQQPGVLSKFNLTVLVTNDFMDAVKNNKPWKLEFPETTFEKYDEEWSGDLTVWKSKGYPVNVWKTFENANELWDMIIKSTYNRNEPGIAFIDRVNEYNNLYYCEKIHASNPCGEQFLPTNGSCNLGSINLTKYVKNGGWDYELLEKDIPVMLRFQDNINDLTNFPIKEQEKEAHSKRRVGIGYMGYGSALYMLKEKYGEEKSLKNTDKMLSFVVNKLYQASALLGAEKGSFPLFEDRYLDSKFIKKALSKETIALIREKGMRNSHLTTVAPTGNTGIFTDVVSGGLEPVISPSYVRTVITPHVPDGLIMPTKIDWDLHVYEVANGWEWVQEGDEYLLRKEKDGTVYKIDRGRGLTREEKVFDYAVLNMTDFNEKDDYAVTLFNLGVKEHVDTMKVFQKYIDASISKTINLPNDYTFEDFKSVYMDAFDSGTIKGITTYRWGTMTSVISTESKELPEEVQVRVAPERPKSLPCHVYKISVKGEKWIVFVGLLNGYPYEVFAGKIDMVDIPTSISKGSLLKQGNGIYSFEVDGDIIIKDVTKIFNNDEQEALTRMISTNLRHGTPVDFIFDQLNKSKGTIADFNKAITRALKKYIKELEVKEKCPNCGGKVVFVEGCKTCQDCGWGACS